MEFQKTEASKKNLCSCEERGAGDIEHQEDLFREDQPEDRRERETGGWGGENMEVVLGEPSQDLQISSKKQFQISLAKS